MKLCLLQIAQRQSSILVKIDTYYELPGSQPAGHFLAEHNNICISSKVYGSKVWPRGLPVQSNFPLTCTPQSQRGVVFGIMILDCLLQVAKPSAACRYRARQSASFYAHSLPIQGSLLHHSITHVATVSCLKGQQQKDGLQGRRTACTAIHTLISQNPQLKYTLAMPVALPVIRTARFAASTCTFLMPLILACTILVTPAKQALPLRIC
jgi:hypothetical protein